MMLDADVQAGDRGRPDGRGPGDHDRRAGHRDDARGRARASPSPVVDDEGAPDPRRARRVAGRRGGLSRRWRASRSSTSTGSLSHLDDVVERLVQHVQLTHHPGRPRVRRSRCSSRSGPSASRASTARSRPSAASSTRSRASPRSPSCVPIFGLTLITAVIPLTTYTLLILVRNNVVGLRGRAGRRPRGGRGDGLHALGAAAPRRAAAGRAADDRRHPARDRHDDRPRDRRRRSSATRSAGSASSSPRASRRFFPTKIYLGAVLSVALAFLADFLFVRLERRLTPWATRAGGTGLMPDILGWLLDPANWSGATRASRTGSSSTSRSALLAVAAATAIGLPVGLYIGHTGRFAGLAINLANIGRAVPSYALMVGILPIALTLAPIHRLRPGPRADVPADVPGDDAPRRSRRSSWRPTPGSARWTATSSRPAGGWA